MYLSKFILFSIVVIMISQVASCDKLTKIKGSIAGTVYMSGRPMMGQVQLLDPKSQRSIKTEPVNNSGHFIISNVPPGEWLLGFLGPASTPLGNFKYVKVHPGRPETGIVFEVTDEDPMAIDLMERIAAQKEETSD